MLEEFTLISCVKYKLQQIQKYWDEQGLLLDTYWRSPPCFLASRSKVKRVVSRRREGRKQADLRSQLQYGIACLSDQSHLILHN